MQVISVNLSGVTGTDSVIHVCLVGAVEIDIEVIDTIQRIERNQCVIVMKRVIQKRGSVLLLVFGSPLMCEGLVDRRTYIQRIAEDMCLMHSEVQHNGTIATILVRHGVGVFTRYIQLVNMG